MIRKNAPSLLTIILWLASHRYGVSQNHEDKPNTKLSEGLQRISELKIEWALLYAGRNRPDRKAQIAEERRCFRELNEILKSAPHQLVPLVKHILETNPGTRTDGFETLAEFAASRIFQTNGIEPFLIPFDVNAPQDRALAESLGKIMAEHKNPRIRASFAHAWTRNRDFREACGNYGHLAIFRLANDSDGTAPHAMAQNIGTIQEQLHPKIRDHVLLSLITHKDSYVRFPAIENFNPGKASKNLNKRVQLATIGCRRGGSFEPAFL